MFFIRQGEGAGWWDAMTALAVGDLVVDGEGCMRLGSGGDLLVWPPGFRLSTRGDEIRILNGEGEVATSVGDRMEVSGGQFSASQTGSRQAFVRTRHRLNIPRQCPGPLFIVGAEVRTVG